MILLRVGRVFDRPGADAVLIEAEHIVAVGPHAELRQRAAKARCYEFPQALLLPGIHDTHTHFYEWARRRQNIDLRPAENFEQLEAILRDAAIAWAGIEEPLWIGGGGWDPNRYGGDPRLSLALLDAIFGARPVALESRDFHTLWCNSAALELAGVLAGRAAPVGGWIGRSADGAPDGFLHELAWDLIWTARPAESARMARSWLLAAQREAHALGITALHSMEPASSLRQLQALDASGELALRVCFHTPLDQLNERLAQRQASYVPSAAKLRLGGVKIFMDGSLGSGTAWMRDGCLAGAAAPLRPLDELEAILLRAGAGGIAGSIHAIGDRCVEEVARCLGRVAQRTPRLRHRIEHAQCATPDALREIAAAGVLCAVQPVHLFDDIPLLPSRWGDAAAHAYPLRSMQRAGIVFGLGSDAPVAPLDWRLGIFAACERRLLRASSVFLPAERIELDAALRGYTSGAAILGGYESELGRVEAGLAADLCVVEDAGPAAADWLAARTLLTVFAGRVVYEA